MIRRETGPAWLGAGRRWRRAGQADQPVAFLWGLVAVSVLALRPMLLAAAAAGPPCLFRAGTGIPCPACGSGRAVIAFLQGRFPAAATSNPLAAAGLLLLLAGGLLAPFWVLAGGPLPHVPVPLPRLWRAATALLLLANWLYLALRGA